MSILLSIFQVLKLATMSLIKELKGACHEKEYPDSYVFVVKMPGLEAEDVDVAVQVRGERGILITGWILDESKDVSLNDDESREILKYHHWFGLRENANANAVSAVCKDGVLTVTVKKYPPHRAIKFRTIRVKNALG